MPGIQLRAPDGRRWTLKELAQGKPLPVKSTVAGFARIAAGAAPLAFTADAKMHPFAFVVSARAQGDGELAAITGTTLNTATAPKKIDRGGRGSIEIEETTLSAGAPFTARVTVTGGRFAYTGANGSVIASDIKADGAWHQVVVSHYTARGETLFYVDGTLAGSVPERLEPRSFGLEDLRAAKPVDVKELLVYRSALNGDEVAALAGGKLLQASLEIYAPLNDAQFITGTAVENKAQSLSRVKVASPGATRGAQ